MRNPQRSNLNRELGTLQNVLQPSRSLSLILLALDRVEQIVHLGLCARKILERAVQCIDGRSKLLLDLGLDAVALSTLVIEPLELGIELRLGLVKVRIRMVHKLLDQRRHLFRDVVEHLLVHHRIDDKVLDARELAHGLHLELHVEQLRVERNIGKHIGIVKVNKHREPNSIEQGDSTADLELGHLALHQGQRKRRIALRARGTRNRQQIANLERHHRRTEINALVHVQLERRRAAHNAEQIHLARNRLDARRVQLPGKLERARCEIDIEHELLEPDIERSLGKRVLNGVRCARLHNLKHIDVHKARLEHGLAEVDKIGKHNKLTRALANLESTGNAKLGRHAHRKRELERDRALQHSDTLGAKRLNPRSEHRSLKASAVRRDKDRAVELEHILRLVRERCLEIALESSHDLSRVDLEEQPSIGDGNAVANLEATRDTGMQRELLCTREELGAHNSTGDARPLGDHLETAALEGQLGLKDKALAQILVGVVEENVKVGQLGRRNHKAGLGHLEIIDDRKRAVCARELEVVAERKTERTSPVAGLCAQHRRTCAQREVAKEDH
eukprot:comp22464_c0_seq1/m.55408 comp22464_c0_seq1/g.55408  ORF comp22464_c0_seq1/g.55408 comp22464_c0_seq1/m.55408 type:complete len:562 (+) comp22464_c0_seq1:659-2344(+)